MDDDEDEDEPAGLSTAATAADGHNGEFLWEYFEWGSYGPKNGYEKEKKTLAKIFLETRAEKWRSGEAEKEKRFEKLEKD